MFRKNTLAAVLAICLAVSSIGHFSANVIVYENKTNTSTSETGLEESESEETGSDSSFFDEESTEESLETNSEFSESGSESQKEESESELETESTELEESEEEFEVNSLLSTPKPQIEWVEDFEYTGSVQEFTAPYTGKYFLEAYGASGGSKFGNGGKGDYAAGYYNLYEGDTIYIYVGEEGSQSNDSNPATFNGGGNGIDNSASGGGATDFRTIKTDEGWYNADSLSFTADESIQSRILVAGGGGGSSAAGRKGYDGGNSSSYSTSPQGNASIFINKSANYSESSSGKFTGAGGGGYLGGWVTDGRYVGGQGGSSYIGRVYDGKTGTYKNEGDGKAIVTYVGEIGSSLTLDLGPHIFLNGENNTVFIEGEAEDVISLDFEVEEGYELKGIYDEDGNLYSDDFYEFTFENYKLHAKWISPLELREEQLEDNYISLDWLQDDNILRYYKLFAFVNNETWQSFAVDEMGDAQEISPDALRPTTLDENTSTFIVPNSGIYKIETYGQKGDDATQVYKEKSKQTTTGVVTNTIKGALGGYSSGYVYLNKGDVITTQYYNGGNGEAINRSGSYSNGRGGYLNGSSGAGGKGISVALDDTVLLSAGGGAGAVSMNYRDTKDGFQTNQHHSSSYTFVSSGSTTGQNSTTCPSSHGGYLGGKLGGGGGGYPYGGKSMYSGQTWVGNVYADETLSSTSSDIQYGKSDSSKAYAVINPIDIEVSTFFSDGKIEIQDINAPDKPETIKMISGTVDNVQLGWTVPSDNGTSYKFKVESFFEDDTEDEVSNESKTYSYTSGIMGYYYIVDNDSSTFVTDEMTFTETPNANILRSDGEYIHVAAVDYNGNLSDTITYQIPAVVTITGNIMWIDNDNKFGYRPTENLTIELRENGVLVDTKYINPNASAFSFGEHPAGNVYKVTIKEIPYYTTTYVVNGYDWNITNTFVPKEDEIMVKPNSTSSLIFKADFQNINFEELGIDKSVVRVTFKKLKTVYAQVGNGMYDISYSNEYSGFETNVFTDSQQSIVGLPAGKYELTVHVDSCLSVKNVTANAGLSKSGKTYYFTIPEDSESENIVIEAVIQKETMQYQKITSLRNCFKQ